jgi:hypothetical protein
MALHFGCELFPGVTVGLVGTVVGRGCCAAAVPCKPDKAHTELKVLALPASGFVKNLPNNPGNFLPAGDCALLIRGVKVQSTMGGGRRSCLAEMRIECASGPEGGSPSAAILTHILPKESEMRRIEGLRRAGNRAPRRRWCPATVASRPNDIR